MDVSIYDYEGLYEKLTCITILKNSLYFKFANEDWKTLAFG